MGQVTTVREIETHQTSVRRHEGLVDLQVGRASTQGLDVDTPLGGVEAEGLKGALLAEELDPVNVLVAAVVAGAGLALGVLVGHGRAEGVEDGAGRDILRGDEDDGLPLALDLLGLEDERVRGASDAMIRVNG